MFQEFLESSETLLAAKMTENMQKVLQKIIHVSTLVWSMFRNDDIIKNWSGLPKKIFPKSF